LVEAPIFDPFRMQGHGRQQIGRRHQLQAERVLEPMLHYREKGQLAGELEVGDGRQYRPLLDGID
jgi:hypothetical protein